MSRSFEAEPMLLDEQIGNLSGDWVADLVRDDPDQRQTILHVERLIQPTSCKEEAASIARILLMLKADTPVVLAGALFYPVRNKEIEASQIDNQRIGKLVTALLRMRKPM